MAAVGRGLTEEDKKKISDSRKGLKLSKGTRDKISLARITIVGISVKLRNIEKKEENIY